MTKRNDWQAFYCQQVKAYGDLIRLPEVLPPRCHSSKQGGERQKAQAAVQAPKSTAPNQPTNQLLDKTRTRPSKRVKEDLKI